MAGSIGFRTRVKQILRPAVLPLARRLKLPFVIMLPRIEQLERVMVPRVEELERRMGASADTALRDKVDALAGATDNLTRTWLRLQNEVARLGGDGPDGGIAGVRSRIDDLTGRLRGLEEGVEAARAAAARDQGLRATVENLTRAWLKLQNELARVAAGVPDLVAGAVAAPLRDLEQRQRDIEQRQQDIEQRQQAGMGELSGHVQHLTLRQQDTERLLREDIAGRGERVDGTLRFLLDRVEFVRSEILLELRYGPRPGAAGAAAGTGGGAVAARVLAPDKVAAAREAGRLRLNLGCGHIMLPDYVNVDRRELPGLDVIAEVGALPFEPGSVDEIASAHLVEHFPQEAFTRQLLPHWRALLRPGGVLRMVTPDGEAMVAGLAGGTYPFEDFRAVLFGGQDYEGDFHYNFLTPDSLTKLVEAAGFTDIAVPVRGRRSGQCFEFELTARLPGGSGQG